MRLSTIGIVLLAALPATAAPTAARADMLVAAARTPESETVRALMRFEDVSPMLESLRGAPAYMASELSFQFKDTMQPELDRFGKVLQDGLRANDRTADIAADLAPFAPRDATILQEAEARIAAQRRAWQDAESSGGNEAFLKRIGAAYEARADRKALDRLVDLRVAVSLAEQNARALTVFVRIVRSVLLDGPGALEKVPDGEWKDGIAKLYASASGDDGFARAQLSRDIERDRQCILLMGLDADQVGRLLAFYESAEGRAWSERLAKAYEERVRTLTSDITIAYVDAVKRRDM